MSSEDTALLEEVFGPRDPQYGCAPRWAAELGFFDCCYLGCYHCRECRMPDNGWHEDDCPNRGLQGVRSV